MGVVDKLVKAALSAAQDSLDPEFRVGAAAYRSGKLIAVGCNSKKTDPQANNFSKRIHAEHALYLNAWRDLANSTVLVLRLSRKNTLSMARPCDSCLPLLRGANVKRILYSNTDQYIRDIDTGEPVGRIELRLEAVVHA